MERTIQQLLKQVSRREAKNRRISVLLAVAPCIAAAGVCATALLFYPRFFTAAAVTTLVLTLLAALRWKVKPLTVSSLEAAQMIDARLSTKDRMSALLHLAHEKAAHSPHAGLIEHQLARILALGPAPHTIAPLALSRYERSSIIVTPLLAAAALLLFLFRPLPPMQALAERISEIVSQNPSLPAPLKAQALVLANTIDQAPGNSGQIRQELSRTRNEISEALRELSAKKAPGDKTLELSETGAGRNSPQQPGTQPQPTSTAGPKAQPPTPSTAASNSQAQQQDKQQQQQQQKSDDSSKQSAQEQSSGVSSQQNDKQGQQAGSGSGAPKNESGNSGASGGDKNPQGQDSKESQGGAQQQQESQDGQQQEGEGSGGSSGAGKSGQGSGSSGQGQQPGTSGNSGEKGGQSNAQGSSGEQGDGGEKRAGAQASGSGSSKQQGPNAQDTGQQEGLEQLQEALKKIEEGLSQKQAQDGSGKEGQGQKQDEQRGDGKSKEQQGSAGKEGSSPGSQGSSRDKQGSSGKESGAGQGSGAASEKASSKAKEPSQAQNSSSADKKPASDQLNQAKQDTNESQSGASGASRPQEARDQTAEEERGESDSLGDRSALPDRNAAPREGGFGDQPSGSGLGPQEQFREAAIEARAEQVDQRFLGQESSLEENKNEARAKTSLEDVTLAKPKPALQRAEQPIPLEYQELLK